MIFLSGKLISAVTEEILSMFRNVGFRRSNLGDVSEGEDGEAAADDGFSESLVGAGPLSLPDGHLADVERLRVADVAVVVANLKSIKIY